MIYTEVDGQTLGLSFTHKILDPDDISSRLTICEVFRLDGSDAPPELIGYNEAFCSKKDNFSKVLGRKLALKRALCQHDFGIGKMTQSRCQKCGSYPNPTTRLSKEARKKIWRDYMAQARWRMRGPHVKLVVTTDSSVSVTNTI